jgi:Na+/melibiose symporter-like transporter
MVKLQSCSLGLNLIHAEATHSVNSIGFDVLLPAVTSMFCRRIGKLHLTVSFVACASLVISDSVFQIVLLLFIFVCCSICGITIDGRVNPPCVPTIIERQERDHDSRVEGG